MVKINMTAEKMEKFEGYKPGKYLALIQAVTVGTSQKGNAFVEATFSGEGFGRINHRMYDNAYGREELYEMKISAGLADVDELDTDMFQGRYVVIEIGQDGTYNDKPRWRVVEITPADVEESDDEDTSVADLGDTDDSGWEV